MFYDFATAGFYSPLVHSSIPAEAVEITDSEYALLIRGLSAGQHIAAGGNGRPMLVAAPPSAPPTREQIEAQRLRAYADPLTGSDRYFAEAQREILMGNTEVAEAAKVLGMARFAEIQAEHPWPAE